MLTFLKLFVGRRSKASRPTRKRRSIAVESLEKREVCSWTDVPTTFGWPSSVSVTFLSNASSGAATISNNEVDVFNFVAPRSGTYTFDAGKNGSQVDTIAGLFLWNGRRIAADDDSGDGTNSRFTAQLVGGYRYAFAITNYTGTSTGGYRWSITGPPLGVAANTSKANVSTWGSGRLEGNTLTLWVSGTNNPRGTLTVTHKVEIWLLDANGRRMNSTPFNAWVKTSGSFANPLNRYKSADSHQIQFDLSSWDLRSLRNLEISVSQV